MKNDIEIDNSLENSCKAKYMLTVSLLCVYSTKVKTVWRKDQKQKNIMKNFWLVELFCFVILTAITSLYTFIKLQLTIHLKLVTLYKSSQRCQSLEVRIRDWLQKDTRDLTKLVEMFWNLIALCFVPPSLFFRLFLSSFLSFQVGWKSNLQCST